MSSKTFTRKKFTILIRKLIIEHSMLFVGLSENAGEAKNIKAASEYVLNQQIPVTLYEGPNTSQQVQLHILHKMDKELVELGSLIFDTKNQKIMKPLSKQFLSKQLSNKKGYIQYKFIASQSKVVSQQEANTQLKDKNELQLMITQNKIDREQLNSLMAIISEKDEIISKMDLEIQRLIKQTRKLNKSLSKQKANSAQQIERNINLNLKLHPSAINVQKNIKANAYEDWQKQKNQYEYEIEKLSRKLRDFQFRQRHFRQQIETMRKKMELDVKDNQKKMGDLRKQIQERYQRQNVKASNKRLITEDKQSEGNLETQRQRKNKYIEEQLAEQIKKIEAQKQRESKRDIQNQLRIQLQKHHQREKQKDRQLERPRQKEREKSRSILRESMIENKEYFRELQHLEEEREQLREKLQIKDEQLNNIVIKLQRAQKEIGKLQDQNIQLRKTKSSLLREVEGITFKQQGDRMKSEMDRRPIQQYEKMIINERKQIVDERLRAEIQQLRSKNRKDQKQYKQKLQQKQMQIMKLKLSQKSANKQKQIYSNRIKQIMQNVEGDRKNFLQALQNAHKFQSQQARTKQLQLSNNELEANNYKLTKQKQQMQNNVKKLKSKLEQRQGEWVRLKSIQAQHDYYKNQCEKFEKAHKKFERQYQSIKEYCQNLQHVVGKKPRKTFDQQVNTEREERYKNQIRNRLELLIQQVKDMENKFYFEQIQIWLTQRTNVIQYYAKKFEDDKARILQMDNINEQAKNNLIHEKEKQLNELKDQQIADIERKVAKIKLMIRSQEQKLVGNMIDKAGLQQVVTQLTEKLQKIRNEEEGRKKQHQGLKQKITKLQTQLKQKTTKMSYFDMEHLQKKSLSLYPEEKDSSKIEDNKKSFIEQFNKKSRDFIMTKPFEELKKLNSELQAEKRKIEADLGKYKFQFEKQRVQLNDKIRTKQRQLNRLEHQVSNNQKTSQKYLNDIQLFKKNKQQLQGAIKRLKDELKQVSRTLQIKQRQCSQALSQIKRMEKNLLAYEQAQKKMFEDVKKMKDKIQKKQLEMEQILQQRNQKSKQIDAQRVNQISKLQQKCKQLQFKLQKQITQNLSAKNQNQKLSQIITEYEVKLKQKQQQYQVLDETFTIYKTEWNEKVEQLQSQNGILQNNIVQIAEQMAKKQTQCYQLHVKIEYSQKREKILQNIKTQLQQQNSQLKFYNEQLEQQKDKQYQKFKQQVRSFDAIQLKIESHVDENARLQLFIKQMEKQIKDNQLKVHQIEKKCIRIQGEKSIVETKLQFVNQRYQQQAKKVEELQQQIQKLQKEKLTRHDQRGRRSNQAIDLTPSSPLVQRRLLNTSINRSSSLVQQPKSSKNIQLIKKSSARQRQPDESEQIKYSKQGIQLNVLPPAHEVAKDSKPPASILKKQSVANRSNLHIEVQSEQENERNNEKNTKMQIGPAFHVHDQPINVFKQADHDTSKPVELDKDFSQPEDQQINQQNQEQLFGLAEVQQLREKINQMQNQIQQLKEQRDGYFQQLKNWRNNYERQSSKAINHQQESNKMAQQNSQLNLNRSFHLKKTASNKNQSDPSSNQQIIDKSLKKQEANQKLIEQLKNRIVQFQLQSAQLQNQISDLEGALRQGENGKDKLMAEIEQLVKNLQFQVNNNKILEKGFKEIEDSLTQKIHELQKQMQDILLQDMKKDQTIRETMSIIQKLNSQIKGKDTIIQSMQSQVTGLKESIEKSNKKLNINKNQYRKYEEEAELQILRLKQKTDLQANQINGKNQEMRELAQRYLQLEEKIGLLNSQISNRDHQILVERSKVKDAFERRDQALEQMKRFEASKSSLLNRVGDLEVKIGQKNEQLKQLTKQTAIAYKKYEIQLQSQKQELALCRKKLKQREQHISNLKLQISNYNDQYHSLQVQKIAVEDQLQTMESQLKQIMQSYQNQLNQLHKDKQALAKQLEANSGFIKQNEAKMQTLNKELVRRGKENKELLYKVDQITNNYEKTKEKNRKDMAELVAQIQIKNDEMQKIKVQLQRQTEHYFTKQCQYLADRQKKQKAQKQYNRKLTQYQKILKQLEQQIKQVQTRPTVQQWEQICFENQLYKNRIQQLQGLVQGNGQQQEQALIAQFKRYKLAKQKQMQDLESELQKYGYKFHSMEENNYVLKKDNDSMKIQLRTIMQQKMRMQKSIKQYEEDIRELKDELNFYKAKRVDDLNKLLNQTYD